MQSSESTAFDLATQSNLTRSQFLIWLGQTLAPDAPLYNMIQTFTFDVALDIEAFQRAFQALIASSDALRTVIDEVDGIPNQRVLESLSHALEVVNFSDQPDPETAYQAWLEDRRTRLHQLGVRLFDTALIQLGEQRFVWYLNQHHLITDGWSFVLVYRRMADLYQQILDGKAAPMLELPAYASYVQHERTFRDSPAFAKAEHYWADKLAGASQPLTFYDRAPRTLTHRTERVVCNLGPERTARLKAAAAEKGIQTLNAELSIYNLLVTIFAAYLHRISSNSQITLGSPFHNRATPAFKETIGVFIEVCSLRLEITEDETFMSLLQKVMRESMNVMRNALPGTSRAEYNRAYEVLLNFVNVVFPPFAGMQPEVEWVHSGYGDRDHALRLQIHDFNGTGSYRLHFDFNTQVFTESQRELAIEHFLHIVDAFLEDRDQPIQRVNLLNNDERSHFVDAFNQTAAAYPADQTIISLFEAQAERTPAAPALRLGQSRLTYAELNARANQLAHHLRGMGIGAESRVAISMDHSLEVVIAILGVLKAGGAYVPIDPAYPPERAQVILDDLGETPVLLTQTHLAAKFDQMPVRLIAFTADALPGEVNTPNPPLAAAPENLAYMIFTSGSTGKPKGVMIEHRSLVNYIWWACGQYLEGKVRDFPLFSSLSFDLTVTSIFTPLISGGQIIVYPEDSGVRGMSILKVIEEGAVDVVKLTPAHLTLIREMDFSQTRIKVFIVGGEDFKTELARSISASFDHQVAIYNEYGPTEATVGCMIHRFDPAETALSVPVGMPVANAQIYVLDQFLNPVPTGVIGEMYIGGDGLARGYLNREDLTAERFIANPFQMGKRLYKTGDLARWTTAGRLEFLGRADHQVKVGGARIELGEIESRLAAHPQIKESVVTVVHTHRQTPEGELRFCTRCGLASNFPGVSYDEAGVCHLCRAYDSYKDRAQAYFRPMADLQPLFAQVKGNRSGDYDCLALFSGGKDSTYMLAQLVAAGLKVLAFTLDNGYISEQAKANIRRVASTLNVDHIFGTTAAMNAIFVDSLKQFANVCNGCFKTIYTLAVNLAREKGIRYIFTGLSRGQFFETRLTPEVFQNVEFNVEEIDHAILAARKAYHRREDVISRELDVDAFRSDALFDDIQFVDFYRYCDVSLGEMYAFLDQYVPWVRPSDTGRSTNCLINDLGIYLHKKQRGYHNYALPYSWDVRMGHKQRDEALEELDDEIDEAQVKRMMQEIGYTEPILTDDPSAKRLAAYYVSDTPLTTSDLRAYLSQYLPEFMLPTYFIRMDALPLTRNGKIDRAALPDPQSERPDLDSDYVAPRNSLEERLAVVWEEALRLKGIGIYDNFFELGGDSITSFQIVSRANKLGLKLKPNHLFQHPTIAALANIASGHSAIAPQTAVSGIVPLTPIQHWFLDQHFANASHWNQTVQVDVLAPVDAPALENALNALMQHHDQLRATFVETEAGWQQHISDKTVALKLEQRDLRHVELSAQDAAVEQIAADAQSRLSLADGLLVHAVLVTVDADKPARLILAVHHLVVDALSWWVLLDDLHTAYSQIKKGARVALPLRTTSFLRWSEILHERARVSTELDYWQQVMQVPVPVLPLDVDHAEGANREAHARTLETVLDADFTTGLLRQVTATYKSQINDALLAALSAAMTGWLGVDHLRIDLEGHGREAIDASLDLTRTVGWFTSIYPVVLSANTGDPGNGLRQMKTALAQVSDHGLGFGLLRYLHPDPSVRETLAGASASILFNHLGQYDTLLAGSPHLRLTKDLQVSRSPAAARPYLIEINTLVKDGQLRVYWTYSERCFHSATMNHLAQQFLHHLQSLVNSSAETVERNAIPAGVSESGLDQAELDALLAEFGEE